MANIDLEVPEGKKTREWYATIAKAYAYGYNRPFFGDALTQVQTILRNRLYYYGEQDIGKNYAFVQGTALVNLNKKDNQIFTIVNSLHGKMVEFVSTFKAYSELLSPNAKSRKELLRSQLMFFVENKDYIETVKQLGVFINPVPEGVIIKTKEDVDVFMETGYREFGAIVAERMASIVLKVSDYANLKPTQFLDLIIGGVTGEDRQLENGIYVEKKILPEALILDLRDLNDNNFNDSAWFAGYWINAASPYEILEKESKWLEPEAIEKIRQAAQSTTTGYGQWYLENVLASPTGYYSYYQVGNGMRLNPVTSMSGVRMYFKAAVDYRYYKTPKGKLKKYRDYNDKGELINQDKGGESKNWRWHFVDLWGGEFVGRHGICNNEYYEGGSKGKAACPLRRYIDGYSAGMYKSRVSRLIESQDDIDLANMKIKQAEMNDLGVNYIISEMGGESEQGLLERIYKQFKSQHMAVIKRDIEENEEYAKAKFAEVVDFTGSLNVVAVYQNIKKEVIDNMNKMMHLPDVSQGLQQTTIGKGVQNTTIQQANTGLAPLFLGFISYIQKGLQLTVNKNKLAFIAPDADQDYVTMLLGENGLNWLKEAVYTDFEELGIYIQPYDVIDSEARSKLNAKLDIYAQQGTGLTPLEDITLMQYTSYREAIAYLRVVYRKREEAAAAKMQQDRQDALVMKQAELDAQIQGKQIPADAVRDAKMIQNQGEDKRNTETNAAKKEINDLQQQVKVLVKQMEEVNKKEKEATA